MLPGKAHFSPIVPLSSGGLGFGGREPNLFERSFQDVFPAHITALEVTMGEFVRLCGNQYLNLGLTPKSIRYLYLIVSGKRTWNLNTARSITDLCCHSINLEYGTKFDISDQVRQVPYLCLSVEGSTFEDRCRLGKGKLYLLRTDTGVSLELSLNPTLTNGGGRSADVLPERWTPFSLVGNAMGLEASLVDKVYQVRAHATYHRSEHIDSWRVPVSPRLGVTVVCGVSTPKVGVERVRKVLVPTSVQLDNVRKLNMKEWERALLCEMNLPVYMPSETGGILRGKRDFCDQQSEYDDEVLSSLRAVTAQGGAVELCSYEFCSSADVQYRAAKLSTTNSTVQVRFQADCDDLGWRPSVAHFQWDVPSFVTPSFMQECQASCKAVARPFLSKESLEEIGEIKPQLFEGPRQRTFGEVHIIQSLRHLVDVPRLDPEM